MQDLINYVAAAAVLCTQCFSKVSVRLISNKDIVLYLFDNLVPSQRMMHPHEICRLFAQHVQSRCWAWCGRGQTVERPNKGMERLNNSVGQPWSVTPGR